MNYSKKTYNFDRNWLHIILVEIDFIWMINVYINKNNRSDIFKILFIKENAINIDIMLFDINSFWWVICLNILNWFLNEWLFDCSFWNLNEFLSDGTNVFAHAIPVVFGSLQSYAYSECSDLEPVFYHVGFNIGNHEIDILILFQPFSDITIILSKSITRL